MLDGFLTDIQLTKSLSSLHNTSLQSYRPIKKSIDIKCCPCKKYLKIKNNDIFTYEDLVRGVSHLFTLLDNKWVDATVCFTSSKNLIRSIKFWDRHGISHEFHLIIVACFEKIKASVFVFSPFENIGPRPLPYLHCSSYRSESRNEISTSSAHKYSDGRD